MPLYYRARERWISVMKGAVTLNASFFNTHRMVQQYVAKLAATAVEYPPMQAPASFNLEAVKAKVEEMIKNRPGQ